MATAASAVLVGCGSDQPRQPTGPVATTDPARAFAPQLRLDGEERRLPMSAAYFLSYSGLEWAGGPCPERDLTASGTLPPDLPSPIPRLDPARLGHGPSTYRARVARPPYCATFRPRVYTSDQRTRPFDRADRPAGLPFGEGFGLDIAREGQLGERKPGGDGALAGVPAYYASDAVTVRDRAQVRFSYWLLFGYEDAGSNSHEGDWERIDVLVRPARRPHVFRPVAVEYHQRSRTLKVPWSEVERVGARATHPVGYLARGRHTPRPEGDCDDCVTWSTWRRLRPIRREPWWGYGGGWGATDRTAATSGPAGPTPGTVSAPPPGR